MDPMLLLKALILGVVEGLTEFLPVSSTGHLIIVGALLDFNDDKGKLFEIVIQIGAIIAICWEYRRRLITVASTLGTSERSRRFVFNLALAFMPAAVLGLLFGSHVKRWLFHPVPVAAALIVGALLILWVERRRHTVRVAEVDDLTPLDAIKLGFAQALALIPGTSRSGATIIGGLFFGLSRRAATEFSFFLAIPTLSAAALYDLYKHRHLLSLDDLSLFGVGLVAAFVSALLAVRALIRFVATNDFTVFAWYRIIFGALVLITWYSGLVDWSSAG
ncbi:MAG: undecaprenyl-diphosphate phosphatase [Burkholderiales bacterium]|nr:undecaprenyl-diphosphate phosphatase [Burkholderiales bacterium]